MCGINGLMYFDQRQVNPQLLQSMCHQMVHRGPDDEGIFCEGSVGLGFRRLSIIDTQGSHQPLANEDNQLWLVGNGEIYNYKTLRKDLKAKGHRFRTNGDMETIVHLYEEFGMDCVHHLRGMFAFIIWDNKRSTFFAARDHFGIKPFYYAYDQHKLVCSSELKSLLAVWESAPKLDEQSLMLYLTYQYVPEPRTMVEGILKLPPAHMLIARQGKVHVKRYWRPKFEPLFVPESQIRNNILESVSNSVRAHMQSDVPRGCFLSSGIDSTAIAALMKWEDSIQTFSVGFEGQHNECTVARQTARELGTDHREWVIGEQQYFDHVRDCIWFQDDPVADPSAIALHLLARMAAQHVKVVLSGEGADELFGGYRIYREPLALKYVAWMPRSLKRALHPVIGRMPHFYGKNYLLRAMLSLEDRFVGNAKVFTDDVRTVLGEKVLSECTGKLTAFQWTKQIYDQLSEIDDVTKMQQIDLQLWLPGNILAKADKMTMAHSLELRVPYLDLEVFEVARRIPAAYRVNRTTTKRIFREAMETVVPQSILQRPKLGFPVPLRQWLRGRRGGQCLAVIESSGIEHYINISYVRRLAYEHQSGKRDHARKIWNIYVLAQWYTIFVQNEISFAASLMSERKKNLEVTLAGS